MKAGYERIKRIMKNTAFISVAALLLTGCGKSVPDGYYVLDSVTEGDKTVKADELDKYGLEGSYVVFDEGEGYVCLMDTPEDATYDSDKGVIKTSFGNISASANGKNLTLADGKLSMKFVLSKEDAPKKPGYPLVKLHLDYDDDDDWEWDDDTDDYDWDYDPDDLNALSYYYDALKRYDPDVDWESVDLYEYDWVNDPYDLVYFFNNMEEYGYADAATDSKDAMSDFWNQYWFGYWTLDAMDDYYKDMEGYKFWVLGKSSMDENGNTEIYLWDNDYDVAEVSGTNNGYGLTDYGTFISESGYFWDGDDLGHADWNVDPGLDSHADSITIEGKSYYDGETSFYYTIHLVHWGSDWGDYDKDDLPDEYDWYMTQIKNGITDPSNLKVED